MPRPFGNDDDGSRQSDQQRQTAPDPQRTPAPQRFAKRHVSSALIRTGNRLVNNRTNRSDRFYPWAPALPGPDQADPRGSKTTD